MKSGMEYEPVFRNHGAYSICTGESNRFLIYFILKEKVSSIKKKFSFTCHLKFIKLFILNLISKKYVIYFKYHGKGGGIWMQ